MKSLRAGVAVALMSAMSAVAWAAPARAAAGDALVVFSSNRTGSAQLWVVDGGGGQRRLTHSAPFDDIMPAWSPDGRYVAFSRGLVYGGSNVASRIVVLDTATGAERALPSAPGTTNFRPAWSPDGSKLAWARGDAAGLFSEIVVGSAGGGDVIAVSAGGAHETFPSWSPDGNRIVYQSDRGCPTTGTCPYDLYVTDLATGEKARRLTAGPGANSQPSWTAAGIVFTSNRAGGPSRLYLVDPATAVVTALGGGPWADRFPSASMDGTRVAYSSNRPSTGACPAGGCTFGIWLRDRTAGTDTLLSASALPGPASSFGESYPSLHPST